jgi:hypothetical protein
MAGERRVLKGWSAALLGPPLLALVVAMVIFFFGAAVLFWVAFFGLAILVAFWTDRASGLTLTSRAWRSALLALWIPLGILGFLAPLRALAVWIQQGLSGFEPVAELAKEPFFFLDFHLFNALIGLCGVVFGLYAGGRAVRQGFKIQSQLERLPRSKAAAAALGLVELSGRVQPAEDEPRHESTGGTEPGLDILKPEDDAVLWRAELASGSSEYVERRGRFWLEDESGRILVDPGTARFRESPVGFLVSELQGLALGRGLRRHQAPPGRPVKIFSLKAGQEAYVLGTAQPDPRQPGRLVVAADPAPLEQGLFVRLFPTSFAAAGGGDPTGFNSPFLVSDARESLTRLALQQAIRRTLGLTLAWILACGAFMTTELRHVGPGAWLPARWIPAPPPPPPAAPLPAPKPAAMFRVTERHYFGIWLNRSDQAGTVNGHWGADSVAQLQARIKGLQPRAVFVLAAAGAEQRLLEALEPAGVTVTVVTVDEFEAEGGRIENNWGLATYADRQSPRSSR